MSFEMKITGGVKKGRKREEGDREVRGIKRKKEREIGRGIKKKEILSGLAVFITVLETRKTGRDKSHGLSKSHEVLHLTLYQ